MDEIYFDLASASLRFYRLSSCLLSSGRLGLSGKWIWVGLAFSYFILYIFILCPSHRSKLC